jgi:hypothetical protein
MYNFYSGLSEQMAYEYARLRRDEERRTAELQRHALAVRTQAQRSWFWRSLGLLRRHDGRGGRAHPPP